MRACLASCLAASRAALAASACLRSSRGVNRAPLPPPPPVDRSVGSPSRDRRRSERSRSRPLSGADGSGFVRSSQAGRGGAGSPAREEVPEDEKDVAEESGSPEAVAEAAVEARGAAGGRGGTARDGPRGEGMPPPPPPPRPPPPPPPPEPPPRATMAKPDVASLAAAQLPRGAARCRPAARERSGQRGGGREEGCGAITSQAGEQGKRRRRRRWQVWTRRRRLLCHR